MHFVSSYCDNYCHCSTCDYFVLWSDAHHYDSYTGSHICGPKNNGSAWCDSATTVHSEGLYEGFCWSHNYAAATTTSVAYAFLGICQLCHGSSRGEFSLSELSLPVISYMICCWLLHCLISAFRFPYSCHVHQWGWTIGSLQHHNPSEYTLVSHMCLLVMVHGPCQECSEWLLLPLLWVGGGSYYSFSCPLAIPSIWWGIHIWGLGRESSTPSSIPTCQGGDLSR